ncbi:MAG TPA: hypothetical protein VMV93_10090 [Chloroflexota bacterium]|nr:hypothetical protein [Chloroflexota bacterium]
MGQRATALEREIVSTREHMTRTIDLMERQFKRTVDWQTKVRANPLPYVLAALAAGFILAGGPRRTFATLAKLRPPKKTRLERLLENLPEGVADALLPPVKRLPDVAGLPAELQKRIREAEREHERQLRRDDEERLRRVARASSFERIALKLAETVGTAVAGILVKQLMERMEPKEDAGGERG